MKIRHAMGLCHPVVWILLVSKVCAALIGEYSDVCCSVLQFAATCCSVLQCVAVCCSQCFAMCRRAGYVAYCGGKESLLLA